MYVKLVSKPPRRGSPLEWRPPVGYLDSNGYAEQYSPEKDHIVPITDRDIELWRMASEIYGVLSHAIMEASADGPLPACILDAVKRCIEIREKAGLASHGYLASAVEATESEQARLKVVAELLGR